MTRVGSGNRGEEYRVVEMTVVQMMEVVVIKVLAPWAGPRRSPQEHTAVVSVAVE